MPAIYAHRAFGEEVRSRLPKEAFPEIFSCPDSYALGLHGPDTLFYYHPLSKNAVNGRGNAMHDASAASFFSAARAVREQRGRLPSDTAYLYGFICHFALDSVCHPEVDAQMRAHALSHTAVEAAFERHMLLKDGLDPVKAHIAGHIRASAENIAAVAAYCGVTDAQAEKSIRSMVRCSEVLRCPNGAKRALLSLELRIAGKRSVIGTIVPAEPAPAGEAAAAALMPCYARAADKACALLENYRAYLAGEAALEMRFASNYESEELL